MFLAGLLGEQVFNTSGEYSPDFVKRIDMTFIPNRVLITGITQANPGVVTCASNHNLTTGQVIRLNIPSAYGMQELNNRLVQITNLTLTTFSIQNRQVPFKEDIDTTNFQAFINAGTGTPAAFVSVGSAPTPILNTSAQIITGQTDDTLDDATINNSTSEIPF